MKDNISPKDLFHYDTADSTIIRSEEHLKYLFNLAGYKLIKQIDQKQFKNLNLMRISMLAFKVKN
jgi:hypothetical protein